MMLATTALFMNLSMPLRLVKFSVKSSKELIFPRKTMKFSDTDCDSISLVILVTFLPAFGNAMLKLPNENMPSMPLTSSPYRVSACIVTKKPFHRPAFLPSMFRK